MPTKQTPYLPTKQEKTASTLASKVVGAIVDAARSMKDAAMPIAHDLFALRILFVDPNGTPDAYGTSGAYKAYVREHVWDVYRRELDLSGESTVLNLGSFQETVQKTLRENTEGWIEASTDLTDTQKDAIRQAADIRKATADKNASKDKPRDALTEARKAVNAAISSSRKSKDNPTGTLDYAGLLGSATELVEQVKTSIVGRTDHGITPKQAATLKTQAATLAALVKSIGGTLDGITRSATVASKAPSKARTTKQAA